MAGDEVPEPSAPSVSEVNRITNLNDILQLEENNLPDEFVRAVQFIYQHTSEDIQNVLSQVSMSALTQLHSLLCAQVSAAHQELQGRRIIKRTIIKTVVQDIICLGQCLVNGIISRDLDKIFLEKIKSSSASPSDDIYNKYVELLETISDYAKRLEHVEAELRSLKSQGTGSAVQGTSSAAQDTNSAAQGTSVMAQDTSSTTQGTNSTTQGTSSTEQSGTAIISNQLLIGNNALDNSVPTVVPRSSVASPSSIPTTSSPSVTVSGVTSACPRMVGGTTNQSRVMAARTNQNRAEPLAEVYIGGAAGSVTCEDVQFELSRLGVHIETSNVRILSDKQDWRSFVAKVPKTKEQLVCNHANWAKDLKIRPFRAPGANKSQNAKQNHQPRRKQFQRHSNHRWSSKQQLQPRRSWIKQQSPALQSCECQTSPSRWSQSPSSYDSQWNCYSHERQYDWNQRLDDAPRAYHDWYDNEFPSLNESYNGYYKY